MSDKEKILMNNSVFISLGSNINPEKNIKLAIKLLKEQFQVLTISKIYKSQTLGASNQSAYLNAAVLITTDIKPLNLKNKLRSIEQKMGRIRTKDKFRARTIDMDIVLYDDKIINIPEYNLIIPDMGIVEHSFIALPLADLNPDFIHPTIQKTLGFIAEKFKNYLGKNIFLIELIKFDKMD